MYSSQESTPHVPPLADMPGGSWLLIVVGVVGSKFTSFMKEVIRVDLGLVYIQGFFDA